MRCAGQVLDDRVRRVAEAPADTRVDDDARREVGEALGLHMAAGRLTFAEYEARLDQVFAARTEAELAAVTRDLPPVVTATGRRRRLLAARAMLTGWLALCALFLTIWALTGMGYFWPVWPIMGTAMGTLPGVLTVLRGVAPPSASAGGGVRRGHPAWS